MSAHRTQLARDTTTEPCRQTAPLSFLSDGTAPRLGLPLGEEGHRPEGGWGAVRVPSRLLAAPQAVWDIPAAPIKPSANPTRVGRNRSEEQNDRCASTLNQSHWFLPCTSQPGHSLGAGCEGRGTRGWGSLPILSVFTSGALGNLQPQLLLHDSGQGWELQLHLREESWQKRWQLRQEPNAVPHTHGSRWLCVSKRVSVLGRQGHSMFTAPGSGTLGESRTS